MSGGGSFGGGGLYVSFSFQPISSVKPISESIQLKYYRGMGIINNYNGFESRQLVSGGGHDGPRCANGTLDMRSKHMQSVGWVVMIN